LLYPGRVFVNRGNHEQAEVNERYGLAVECVQKYGSNIGRGVFEAYNQLFLWFPLVHVINTSVMVVHGGLTRRSGTTLQHFQTIERGQDFHQVLFSSQDEYTPLQRLQALLAMDLMWSDPMENAPPGGWRENYNRGAGIQFGSEILQNFLADNPSLRMVVRSHECKQRGFDVHFHRTAMEGKLVTVFSASNYHEGAVNQGAILIFPVTEEDEELSAKCRVYSYTAMALSELEITRGAGSPAEHPDARSAQNTPIQHSTLSSPPEDGLLSPAQRDQIAVAIQRELVRLRKAFEFADYHHTNGLVPSQCRSRSAPGYQFNESHRTRPNSQRLQRARSEQEQGKGLSGLVQLSQWIEIMTDVLQLPLPWLRLRHELLEGALVVHRQMLSPTISTGGPKMTSPLLGAILVPQDDDDGTSRDVVEVDYNTFLKKYEGDRHIDSKLQRIGLSKEALGTLRRHRQVLEAIFIFFDQDGSGRINASEFLQGCQVLNANLPEEDSKMTMEDMEALMNLMDEDCDGEIDFEEFVSCFTMANKPSIGSITTQGYLQYYHTEAQDQSKSLPTKQLKGHTAESQSEVCQGSQDSVEETLIETYESNEGEGANC